MSEQEQREQLEAKLEAVQNTLGSLIVWMAQSANSPIRADEASILSNIISGDVE